MEKWREDAQPEWPQAASATRDVPVVGGEAQAFPETGAAGGSEILEGGRQGRHGGRAGHASHAAHGSQGGRIRTESSEPSGPPGSSWPVVPKGVRKGPAGSLTGTPIGPSGALADPWGAPAANDPDEVTVQLDGPAEELDDPGAKGAGHDGSEGPVFVDESGRRSRRYRRIGMAVGIACAVYAVVIVATLLSGSSDAPWLPVPGQKDDPPASKVDTSPLPAESGRPSGGGGSVAPGNIPTASDGTTPSPGASASASGASKAPGSKASTSASAKPSASKSASAPAGGTVSNPVVQPSHPQDTPSSGPSTPTGGTSAPAQPTTPTPTPTAGTGTVADAPNTPSPVAQGPAAPSEPAPAPSPSTTPEHIV
ncbi:hypothetical protein [Streptomyces hokutonensis]|uniref:hypothetical protein n=1 Tax=Streptomyces hokutonensis TaxID=1306990 RepID=UPI0033C7660F